MIRQFFFIISLILIIFVSCFKGADLENFNIKEINFENCSYSFVSEKTENKVFYDDGVKETKIKCVVDNDNVSIFYKINGDFFTLSNNEKSQSIDLTKIDRLEIFFALKNKIKKYNFLFEKKTIGEAKLKNISTVPVVFIPEFSENLNEYTLKVQYKIKKIYLKASGEKVNISYKINDQNFVEIQNDQFSNPIYFTTGNSTLFVKASKPGYKDNIYKINITRYENADIGNIEFTNSEQLSIIEGDEYNIYAYANENVKNDTINIYPADNDAIPYIYKTGNEHIAIPKKENYFFDIPLDNELNEFIIGIVAIDGFIKNYKLSIAKSEKAKIAFNIPPSKMFKKLPKDYSFSEIKKTETKIETETKQQETKVTPPDEKTKQQEEEIKVVKKDKEEVKKLIKETNVFLENLKITAIFKYNYELQLYPDFNRATTNYETYINSSVEAIEVVPYLQDQELNLKIRFNDGRFRTAASGVKAKFEIKDATVNNKLEVVVSDNSGNSLLYTVIIKPF